MNKPVIRWLFLLVAIGLVGLYLTVTKVLGQQSFISPFIQGTTLVSQNIWFPKQTDQSGPSFDNLTAQSVMFIELSTGNVLYEKNAHQRSAIASLNKIMTAIVTLEHKMWNDEYTVSPRASQMVPDHMMLQPGEKLTVGELMPGLFLVSANDAAEVLAEGTLPSRDEFISKMNQTALTLGMKDTHFVNPSGLDEDNNPQYSSAYDVALMARYAITHFPQLIDITSQPEIYIEPTNTHQAYDLVSGINLVTTYPGVKGFKTGYTPEAGLTLVTYAERNNHKVLGVLLSSQNRREEARMLLDYAFQKLGDN